MGHCSWKMGDRVEMEMDGDGRAGGLMLNSGRELFFLVVPSLTTSAKPPPRLNFWLLSTRQFTWGFDIYSIKLPFAANIVTMAGNNVFSSFKWLSRSSRGLLSGAEATTV